MSRPMEQATQPLRPFTPSASKPAGSHGNDHPTLAFTLSLAHATNSSSRERNPVGPYAPLRCYHHLGRRALALVGLLLATLPVRGGQTTSPSGAQATTTQTPASTFSRQERLARLEARRAYWRERIVEARRHLESWYQRRLVRITEIRNIAAARRDQDALDRLAELEAKLETIYRRRTELLDRAMARLDD